MDLPNKQLNKLIVLMFKSEIWDSSKRGKPSWELLFSGTVKVMQEEKGCGRPQQRQVKREGRKEPDE